MTLNLSMEPTFIVETMSIQWISELTFAENVPALIKQFKKERGLKPFKVVAFKNIIIYLAISQNETLIPIFDFPHLRTHPVLAKYLMLINLAINSNVFQFKLMNFNKSSKHCNCKWEQWNTHTQCLLIESSNTTMYYRYLKTIDKVDLLPAIMKCYLVMRIQSQTYWHNAFFIPIARVGTVVGICMNMSSYSVFSS